MYLKKLEIFGFKSFAEKTVLNFEPGITAIVGPNGCGKSNIFDSIRWVLGEQSMKELRGSSKEDVIFNGTEKKPALGFAEVSLVFANNPRVFPIERDEVVITRKLFRSGESEYLLNRQSARLKDIQELLMGTGIGAEAYSLIQQGKVDLVVSAKPEDRRMIFDEASGITKYKAKKKEALNKLKDTENNLLRVNDIVVEVRRQIGSIERQANKARKFKDEFEKLKVFEIEYSRNQLSTFSERKRSMDAQIDELKEKENVFSQELDEISNVLTNEINMLDDIEQKINEINSEEIRLDGQIDLANRQIGFNQERMESLSQNKIKLTDQKSNLIEKCKMQQEKIENLKQTIASIEGAMLSNHQKLSEQKDSFNNLDKIIKESKEKIREHEEKILDLSTKQVNIRNEMTDVVKELQGVLARKRRLEMENEKVFAEKSEIDRKLTSIDEKILSLRQHLDELNLEKAQKDIAIDEIKSQISTIEHDINELEKKTVFLRSQKEFIEKLNTQYHDIPDPLIEGRIITQTAPLDHHTGIIGKVKQVNPLSAEKLQEFKRNFGQDNIENLYEIICETKFIELDPQQITIKIEEIAMQIEETQILKTSKQAELKDAVVKCEELNSRIQNREREFSVLSAQKDDIQTEGTKISSELELIQLEISESDESLNNLKRQEDETKYQLDTITQELIWCQHDIKDKQDVISAKAQDKETILVELTQLETELHSVEETLKNHNDNHLMFTEALDSWLDEINKIEDELTLDVDKIVKYEQEIEELTTRIDSLVQGKETFRDDLADCQIQKEDLAQKINSDRANMLSIEEEIEKIKEELHSQELSKQQFFYSQKEIKDRLEQLYKINYDELNFQEFDNSEIINFFKGSDNYVLEDLENEIGRLRKRCDSFGSVNLDAMDEYEEFKERFEFLTKQQADLLEAKSQLLDTIKKINRSTKQMFMDTFTKVGEEFRIHFRMLFGGGEAELVLLDPENVLESGIDIIARPPGKKLQNISLMSGGEKTLTAIALIFGVFKVNPSPFCVLDEIDAALDESNVGRFSFLLKDFSKIAQFVVITHNKKTIASSDVMYGITMPETGVSRIVSVKFSESEKVVAEEIPAAV